MTIIDTINDVDWGKFKQPTWNKDDEIKDALLQLMNLQGEDVCHTTYNRVLYAIGNNHCGILNEVAVPATNAILSIALLNKGSSSNTALEILCEILYFNPECEKDGDAIKSCIIASLKELRLKFMEVTASSRTNQTICSIEEALCP